MTNFSIGIYKPKERNSDLPITVRVEDTTSFLIQEMESQKTFNSETADNFFDKTINTFNRYFKYATVFLTTKKDDEEEIICRSFVWFINMKLWEKEKKDFEIPDLGDQTSILRAFWESLLPDETEEIQTEDILPMGTNALLVQTIIVNPQYRNQGFARYLMANTAQILEVVNGWNIEKQFAFGKVPEELLEEDKNMQNIVFHLLKKFKYSPYFFADLETPLFFIKK